MTRPFRDLCDPPPNYRFESDLEWLRRKADRWALALAAFALAYGGVQIGIAEMKQRPVERVMVAEIWR